MFIASHLDPSRLGHTISFGTHVPDEDVPDEDTISFGTHVPDEDVPDEDKMSDLVWDTRVPDEDTRQMRTHTRQMRTHTPEEDTRTRHSTHIPAKSEQAR